MAEEIIIKSKSIDTKRSEEVQDIIERMPTAFGFWVTLLVIILTLLLLIFGWVVKYPDIVSGNITISANIAPVMLVSNSSGRLNLNVKSLQTVNTESYLAWINNPASIYDVIKLKSILLKFDIKRPEATFLQLKDLNLSLGELSEKYYVFLNSLQENTNNKHGNIIDQQSKSLLKLSGQQMENATSVHEQLVINKKTLEIALKSFQRDSILFKNKVETEAEFEKAKSEFLNTQQQQHNLERDYITSNESIYDTKSKIHQAGIQNIDKKKQIQLSIVSSYSNLISDLRIWEQRYCIISPISGKVQFLKFWINNQYIQTGEEVFNIIPDKNGALGQVLLPAIGAGKVKVGQEVIIKLENFPYEEYGSVVGKVNSISLTPKTVTIKDQTMDYYLVNVDLPNGLKTNYGSYLDFKFQLKGTAEIIVKDRRLAERLFDNIRYIIKR